MPLFFSKFIWADWLLDHAVRRCSPAARGLWLDMLALSVRSEPVGVLADGETALTVADIARAAGVSKRSAARLLDELESNGVFSRDERGRIYSRRIVREHRLRVGKKACGSLGGNPQLTAKNGLALDNHQILQVKSQELGVTSQQSACARAAPDEPDRTPPEPEPVTASPDRTEPPPATAVTASPQPPKRPPQLPRALALMGTTIEAVHKKTGWMAFDYAFANWLEEGADAERDIWPAIEALTAKLGRVPASPAYFTGAIREARDRRLSFAVPAPRTLRAPYLASTAVASQPTVDPDLEADRRATFERTGAWSSQWGPRPDGRAGISDQESGIRNQESGIRNQNGISALSDP